MKIAVLALALLASVAPAQSIRRLDGSSIAPPQASASAAKTLAEAHVTGAQLAILNSGRLVWSLSYGLRSQPTLPFNCQTTTNSDNGEIAFRPLLEHLFGDTVTPWEWEGYPPATSRRNP